MATKTVDYRRDQCFGYLEESTEEGYGMSHSADGDIILVIGNGFDLFHGKKTKYSDFLEFIKNIKDKSIVINVNSKYSIEDNALLNYFLNRFIDAKHKDNWIDMERDLKDYVRNVISFIDEENEANKDKLRHPFTYRSSNISLLHRRLIENMDSFFTSNGSGKRVKNEYIDYFGFINKEKVLNRIESELNDVCGYLLFYLKEYEPANRNSVVKKHQLFLEMNPVSVVSFNYTKTYNEIYGLDDSKIAFVHGTINDKNIVLGYNDEDSNMDDITFKKYYKRMLYGTGMYSIPIKTDDYGGYITPIVCFFGHSLDVSDEDIIKDLVKNRKIRVYYRVDSNEKAERLMNLIKIMGKEYVEKGISDQSIIFIPIETDI